MRGIGDDKTRRETRGEEESLDFADSPFGRVWGAESEFLRFLEVTLRFRDVSGWLEIDEEGWC